MSILNTLEQLKATSKRTEKEQILKDIPENELELFKRVCVSALDERIVFNVKEYPAPENHSGVRNLNSAIDCLSALSSRLVTGHDATTYLKEVCQEVTESDAEVLDRIIKKDLRCGVGATTLNKVFPNLIHIHPYMRRSSFSEKNLAKIKLPAFSQRKEDGMYVDIVVDSTGKVTYLSRAGIVLPFNSDRLDSKFSQRKDSVFQGESLIVDEETGEYLLREEGNGYINSDNFDKSLLVIVVWDIIPLEEWKAGQCNIKYVHRFNQLKQFIEENQDDKIRLSDTIVVKDADAIIDHFRDNIEKGFEGTIVKNMDAVWKDGTSTEEVKIKIQFECELEVVEDVDGEAKSKYENMMGALRCKSSDGLLETSIGSGFKDIERKERPYKVGDIITVRANEILYPDDKPAALFLPRFIEKRNDKFEADSLDRIKEQKASALEVFVKMFGSK